MFVRVIMILLYANVVSNVFHGLNQRTVIVKYLNTLMNFSEHLEFKKNKVFKSTTT